MLRCRCDRRFRRPLQWRVIFFTDRILPPAPCFGKIFFHRKPDCPMTRCLIKFFLPPETGMPHSPPFRNVFSAGNRNAPQTAVPEAGHLRRNPDVFHVLFRRAALSQKKITSEISGSGGFSEQLPKKDPPPLSGAAHG